MSEQELPPEELVDDEYDDEYEETALEKWSWRFLVTNHYLCRYAFVFLFFWWEPYYPSLIMVLMFAWVATFAAWDGDRGFWFNVLTWPLIHNVFIAIIYFGPGAEWTSMNTGLGSADMYLLIYSIGLMLLGRNIYLVGPAFLWAVIMSGVNMNENKD